MLLQVDVEMPPILHSASKVEPSEEIDVIAPSDTLILPQSKLMSIRKDIQVLVLRMKICKNQIKTYSYR